MLLRFIPSETKNWKTLRKMRRPVRRARMALCAVTQPAVLELLRALKKAQSRCSQSKHGLYGHVTPNFTARENQRNSTEEEAGTAFS